MSLTVEWSSDIILFLMLITVLQRGDPIEERYKEHMERGPIVDQLTYCINSYRDAAMSKDPKFEHIDTAEKEKVKLCLDLRK